MPRLWALSVRRARAGVDWRRVQRKIAPVEGSSPPEIAHASLYLSLSHVSPDLFSALCGHARRSVVAVLHLMCDDREWTVRHAAIKSIVLVECGPKMLEGVRSDAWKPAGKRIMVSTMDVRHRACRHPGVS